MKKPRENKRPRRRVACLMLLLAAGVLLAATAFQMRVRGAPQWIITRIEHRLQRAEFDLRIKRLSWRWPIVLVIEEADYHTRDCPGGAPIISLERLVVTLRPHIRQRRLVADPILVQGAVIRVPTYPGAIEADSPANLMLTGLRGRIRHDPAGRLVFETLEGHLQGIPFLAQGDFHLPETRDPERTLLERGRALYGLGEPDPDGPPAWVAELVREFSACTFEAGNNFLSAQFNLDLLRLDHNHILLTGGGTALQGRGLAITNWAVHLELEQDRLTGTNLLFETQGHRLEGEAQYDFTADQLSITARSDWPLEQVQALLPGELAALLAAHGFAWEGASSLALHMGPAPRAEIQNSIQAKAAQLVLHFRGATLHHLGLHLEWDGDALWLHHAQAEIPLHDRTNGFVTAGALVYPAERAYAVRFSIQAPPSVFLPFCGEALSTFIGHFVFPGPLPAASGKLTGSWGDEHVITSRGTLQGEHFLMHDVHLLALVSDLLVDHEQVVLQNVRAARHEGVLEGDILLSMTDDTVSFDIISAMNPGRVIEMINPELAAVLNPIEFLGDSFVAAAGQIDYMARTQMQFRIEADVDETRLFDFAFQDTSFVLAGQDDAYHIETFSGLICGGLLEGSALLTPKSEDHLRYEIDMLWTNLALDELIALFEHPDDTGPSPLEQRHGYVHGHLTLQCVASTNEINHLTADGALHVRDGTLLSIKLFGPLSRWLSNIAPSLGYLTQTDFDADFKLRGDTLHLDNASLHGAALRIQLNGTYEMDTRELDFRVQIRFLRDGIFARVVNLVTYPLTKLLLEFHLGGTLEEPSWRPVNVPKELYFNFN